MAWPAVSLLHRDRLVRRSSQLGWLRLHGQASLFEPGISADTAERRTAIGALRGRYPQYAGHDLESRPIIAIELTEAVRWAAADG